MDGLGFRINPRGSEDSIFCMFSEVSENSWKNPNTAGGRHFSKHFSKFSSKCPFKNFQMEKFHLLTPQNHILEPTNVCCWKVFIRIFISFHIGGWQLTLDPFRKVFPRLERRFLRRSSSKSALAARSSASSVFRWGFFGHGSPTVRCREGVSEKSIDF